MRFTREGWPSNLLFNYPAQQFRRISNLLSNCHGYLLYGTRLVIPPLTLRKQVLPLLHTSLGMKRMKQLARTAVYRPNIDTDIVELCRTCASCCEHRNSLLNYQITGGFFQKALVSLARGLRHQLHGLKFVWF